MPSPRHPPSTCFHSCPLLTTHRLPVSSHVHSSPPTVYLFPVCPLQSSRPLLTTHRLPVSSHVHSSPPTVYLFPVMSTPHHPPSTCFQSCPLLTTHRLSFQSCPLLTTHCLAVLHPVMSTPHHPLSSCSTSVMSTPHHLLSSCSTSSHVHSSPPIV